MIVRVTRIGFVLACMVALVGPLQAETSVGGSIAADRTWILA